VATNHLPHIYDPLRAIAEQQGIVLDAPPAVRFIDLNERRREKCAGPNSGNQDDENNDTYDERLGSDTTRYACARSRASS
jgi:hypothetical protein